MTSCVSFCIDLIRNLGAILTLMHLVCTKPQMINHNIEGNHLKYIIPSIRLP